MRRLCLLIFCATLAAAAAAGHAASLPLGGIVWPESKPGEGAAFYFSVPTSR